MVRAVSRSYGSYPIAPLLGPLVLKRRRHPGHGLEDHLQAAEQAVRGVAVADRLGLGLRERASEPAPSGSVNASPCPWKAGNEPPTSRTSRTLTIDMPAATDARGHSVSLDAPPRRIVSLVPSQTELLAHLGLRGEVAGVTRFCERPKGWRSTKTIVGGTKQVDVVTVRDLDPDLDRKSVV